MKVTEGNAKLGRCLSWSLMPGETCSAQACKTCLRQGCYAMKFARMRASVRACWQANTDAVFAMEANGDYSPLVEYVNRVIRKKRIAVTHFRIHVGGDFFSAGYARAWARIARANPSVSFLAYTKQYANVRGLRKPRNLTIIASEWDGCTVPEWASRSLGRAVVIPKAVMPTDGFVCPGDCSSCHACWAVKAGQKVYFHKH